jgi:DNA gyrase subunit A
MNLTPIIKESFTQYAGAVLQSRALPDVRDMLKPSARQIFYCLYTDKFTHNKPFKKTLKAIGSAMRMYIHGDSSCEGILMRSSQDFAMRYPYIEVEGSNGDPVLSGNWSAPRYTSSRLSPLSEYLFKDIEKETIKEWRDNYDDTEQYPAILPTKGFYGIVNGGMGIGVGAAFSCPQFNLKEVNEALIKLLDNPEISFDEIYCAPDFASGAILLNEAEVKESLKKGEGLACKLRSVVSFDSGERCLIVTEIPYGVYTNTICGELNKILEDEANPGIERYNDLTKGTPIIKIYLKRAANPDKVLKYLYKNTSLQSHFGINLTMLENGRYPKVFGWREALQAHINHEKEVYRRGYEFDLNKIEQRIYIIEGLLICLARIEEVIQTIKSSSSTITASKALCENFLLDEAQAKAVLDMKLSRLAHLEVEKLKNEKEKLEKEAAAIKEILNNTELFNEQLKNGWREVAKKFGDARRTKILNISNNDEEPTEIRQLILNFTNIGNIFISESSTLYTQKKGGVGTKFKLEKGEYVVSNRVGDNTDTVLFFSNRGNFYHLKMSELPVGEKIHTSGLISIHSYEEIRAATILSKKSEKKYIIFITKKGIMKKSLISEYNIKRSGGARAIELGEDDEIVSILFTNEEPCGILTAEGNLLLTQTKDVRAIGRIAKGIRGIKLNDNDYVVSARPIPNSTKKIMSISGLGLSKKTDITEFTYTGKNTKGKKIQKIINSDFMVDFIPITTEKEILVVSSGAQLKVSLDEITNLSRGAQGSKTIKLKNNEKVISLQKI